MDKFEYIHGDLVYFGGEKAKVELYNPSADDSVWVRVIENGGENRTWNASLKYEISPIPLTSSILEKNGWKPINGKYAFKIKNANYLVLDFTEDGINSYINEKTMLFVIKYLHELQHLFFGLGLNSEMEV